MNKTLAKMILEAITTSDVRVGDWTMFAYSGKQDGITARSRVGGLMAPTEKATIRGLHKLAAWIDNENQEAKGRQSDSQLIGTLPA